MSPLITDDENYEEPEEKRPQDPIEQLPQKMAEKGASFKSLLQGIGAWLAARRVPEPVKQGIAKEWQSIWSGQKPTRTKKKPEKFLGTPFKTFNKNKKSKLD